MEEVKQAENVLPLSPDVIGELVTAKETSPVPPIKTKYLPYFVIGLFIALIILVAGLIVWNLIKNSQQPDLVITAPITLTPTPISFTQDSSLVLPQEAVFEPEPYRNLNAGFEIRVPFGWSIDDSGKSGAVVVLLDPRVTLATSSALVTFVSVTTGSDEQTLDQVVQSSKDNLKRLFESYVFDEDKEIVISGIQCYLLGGTYTTHNTIMRNRNLILFHNQRGYAISATSPASVWSKREPILNATLFSFKNL